MGNTLLGEDWFLGWLLGAEELKREYITRHWGLGWSGKYHEIKKITAEID